MIQTQTNSQKPTETARSAGAPESRAELQISVDRPHRDAALVTVVGRLDMATSRRLDELLHHRLSSCLRVMVLDLTGITFFNTTALEVLQRSQQHAEQRDISLRIIVDTRGRVQRLLGLLGLSHRFLLYPGREEALQNSNTTSHYAVATVAAGA